MLAALKQYRAQTRDRWEKEDNLNLQRIIRAAVCAVTAIALLAGAGWFPLQTAAGQEIKQQVYRPGLRNSFVGVRLSPKELELTLAQLRGKTGFKRIRFDDDGFLTIDDRSEIEGGSAMARELLLAAIDGKKSITLQSRDRSPEVVFARVAEAVNYENLLSDSRIEMAPIEIDFADFSHLRGERKALEAFDLGFAILHELCHAALELRDPSAGAHTAGDCESTVNRIRRELGMPERRRYAADVYRWTPFSYGPEARIAELIFAQTEPGAKTKKLILRWDVKDVGNTLRRQ